MKELPVLYIVIPCYNEQQVLPVTAPMFFEKLKEGGTLITSGIIEERADEVGQALEQAGFRLTDRQVSGGWAAFTAVR